MEVNPSNPWFLDLLFSSRGFMEYIETTFDSSRLDWLLDSDLLLLPDRAFESLSSSGLIDTPEEIEIRFLGIRRLVIFGNDFFRKN